MDTEKHDTCEHCGGMVDEDGLALVLSEEPTEEPEALTEEAPKRNFAAAVERSKGGS